MEVCFVAGGVREFVEAQVAAFPSGSRERRPRRRRRRRFATRAEAKSSAKGSPTTATPSASAAASGVAAGKRSTCSSVEPEENGVVVGDEAELLAPGLVGERLHWIGDRRPRRGRSHGQDPLAPPRRRGARPSARRRPRSRSTSPSRSAASRPARPPSSTAAPASSAAAGSPGGSEVNRSATLSSFSLVCAFAFRSSEPRRPRRRKSGGRGTVRSSRSRSPRICTTSARPTSPRT